MKGEPGSQIYEASRHLHGLGGIVIGVLLLAAIVAELLHIADIRHVINLAASLDPLWLALAVALQTGTYLGAAAVCRIGMYRHGY